MKTSLFAFFLICSSLTFGQGTGSPVQVIPFTAPPPPAVAGASYSITGLPGQAGYWYWVVAHYPIGYVQPAAPVPVLNAPNTLNASNYVTVYWTPPAPQATAYDVLRTSTPVFPGSCTGCAVVTGTTSLSVQDQGGTLGNYTFTGATAATITLTLNNRDYSTPLMLLNANQGYVCWNSAAGNNADCLTMNTNDQLFAFYASGNGGLGANFLFVQPANNPNTSTAGFVRLGAGDSIGWRNNANNANILLAKNTSDQLTYNSNLVPMTVMQACGTTTTCAATNNAPTSKVVYGSVTLTSGSPSTATVTGFSPAFSSSTSYVCTATDVTNASAIKVVNASASSITITGPNTVTDQVNYTCVGN